jgi:pimeloyl-ACP methyl ester carboxylesterase
MPFVHINGIQISYWKGGRNLLEGKEVVLFIHGAGGGEFVWSYQKGFFEKQCNPIIIELPGHGKSEGEGEQEIRRYAEHVHAFLKAMGLLKVSLIGHSMGGAIVLTLALTHPELIHKIVLAGTGARLRVYPGILNGIKDHFEESVPKMLRFAFSRRSSLDLIEKGISNLMKCGPEVLYSDFLACDRFDLMKEVEKIDLPTLILSGEEDEMAPVKYSQFLHDRIKGSKMEILPDAGHMVMMESPQVFNEKIGEFIFENSKGFEEFR